MAFGVLREEARLALLVLGLLGGLMLLAGLIYALIRQLRRRRFLPASRYRGPSIVLMVVLAAVAANMAALPFSREMAELLSGRDASLSLPATVIVITSTQLALLAVTWLFVIRPRAIAFARPLLGANWLRAGLAGVGWGIPAWLAASALTLGFALLFERIGVPVEPQVAGLALEAFDPWLMLVAIVVLAPVAEEVFFRGVAFNAWLLERGRRFAYLGSAALFAAIHMSLVSLLPIGLLGLALAWVYRRTGSLMAPIAMHATVNGISATLALLIRFEVLTLPS